MCNPLFVMAGIAIVQQVSSFQEKEQAADDARENQAREQQFNNQVLANRQEEFLNTEARLNLRGLQEREAAASRSFETSLKSLRETSRAQAAASEVSGISVDALLADFGGQGARAQDNITANLAQTLEQLDADRLAAFSPVQSAFLQASQPRRTIRDPSKLALGVGIAGSVAGAQQGNRDTTGASATS